MPLTLAHPAIVLPLRAGGLPLSALVIGSMVPDAPLFARSEGGYQVTHSVVGAVTVDLLIGLVALAFWDLLARDALVDLSPGPIRDRLPARRRLGRTAWLLAPLALVVGSISHIVWDLFTHRYRWGTREIDWLHEAHGPLRGYMWFQYVSGVLGLAVALAAIVLTIRRGPPQPPRPRRLPAATLPVGFLVACAVSAATGLSRTGLALHTMAFWAAIGGIIALAAGLAVLSLAWALSPSSGDAAHH